jgi:hypothetical protein
MIDPARRTRRRPDLRPWWLAASLVIGAIVFAPILRTSFLADDWDFLTLVTHADSVRICFIPLIGRFIRPLVMLTYYVNYHAFGLSTLPYHLTIVLVHAVDAWLVSLLALRLARSDTAAVGAGLIFLLFAGHSEPVSWVGACADVWLVLFLVPGLLLFDTALDADRPAIWIAASIVVFTLGVLGKESAIIAPALVGARGLAALLEPGRRDVRRVLRSTAVTIAVTGAAGLAYVGFRRYVFGSAFGAYGGLGTSQGRFFVEASAFVLRSFLPPGWKLTALWARGFAVGIFGAGLIVLAVLWIRRPDTRPTLAFLLAGLVIALLPVLPLSISVATITSERFVYVPSVFTCLFTAWIVVCLAGHRRALAVAVIALIVLVQARGLIRSNRAWRESGALFQSYSADAIDLLRRTPPPSRIFVLNVPDNVRGALTVRSAFHSSLDVLAPEIADPKRRVAMTASTGLNSGLEAATLERTGPRTFRVGLASGSFMENGPHATPEYSIDAWRPNAYAITFHTINARTVVTYVSGGHLQTAAVLDGMPFGYLDLPQQDVTCDDKEIRFAGWALDDESGVSVALERDADRPGPRVPLGTAEWRTGTRPDVTGAFREYPQAERAEWNFHLPCAARTPWRVHAIAIDRAGQRVELGARTVLPGTRDAVPKH